MSIDATELARRIRHRALVAKVSADNANYECGLGPLTIAEADLIADVLESVVHCMNCGKPVSGFDPELGLVVRAWVECPECLEKSGELATEAEP